MTTDYRALCAELAEALGFSNGFLDSDGKWVVPEPIGALVARARALLDTPERVAPTDEPMGDLIDTWVQEAFNKRPYGCSNPTHAYVACKAFEYGKNHAARPTPTPIPVSERLPETEDCDAEGRCWFYVEALGNYDEDFGWKLLDRSYGCNSGRSHWLPAHALPLPAALGEGE